MLGAPRVPTRRRVEFTYQKSVFLNESALCLKLKTDLHFLAGPAGRAGWPGRGSGEGIWYYRCSEMVLEWICFAYLVFFCIFYALAMDLHCFPCIGN